MRDGAAWFVAGLGLLIGTVLLVGARNISPPMFDPVGSAALPRTCASALIGLGLGVLAQSWRRRTAGADEPQTPAPSTRVALWASRLRHGFRAGWAAAPRERLVDLIALYVEDVRERHAEVRMQGVRQHFDETDFAWKGTAGGHGSFCHITESMARRS